MPLQRGGTEGQNKHPHLPQTPMILGFINVAGVGFYIFIAV